MVLTLADILSNSSKNFPDAIALKTENSSFTYQQLEEKCNQLANVLLANGVSKGDCVGVYLHRCVESFIAVHAILKVGAVFVPLDVKYPTARISRIISDCSIKAVISSENQSKTIAELENELPELLFLGLSAGHNSIPWTEIFNQPNQIQASPKIIGSDAAYIMYSSGSTGVPKGIVHTHNSGLSYAKQAAKLYQINTADVIVSHSTLSYDISTFAYFSSLLAGATTLVLSDLLCMVPASLSAFLEQERATVWYSVPLALRQLLNFGALESRNLGSMRWVLYGGEPLPVNEANQLLQLFPNAMFSNVYGPAEVNQCTYYNFKELDAEAKEIPLGVVWDEADYLLIDDDDAIISATNKTGELVIHSSTMMTGYWQNSKPENEIYFFAKTPSAEKKYYRTGDLVSRGADELLYFVGRKDRQVKIQGYRVELKEIEYQLGRLDYLKDWAAIADKTSKDYAFIGVFAVLEMPVETDTKKAINHHLKRFLPSYALPEKVIFLSEMPYASSGKKDYSKLNEYLKTTDEGQTKGVY